MEGIGISESALISLVRDILDGEDFKNITPKIVRERVLKTLKNPNVDLNLLKASVKSALDIVLVEYNQDTDPSVPNKGEQTTKDLNDEEKSVDVQQAGEKPSLKAAKIDPGSDDVLVKPESALVGKNLETVPSDAGKGVVDTVAATKAENESPSGTDHGNKLLKRVDPVDETGDKDDDRKSEEPVKKSRGSDSDEPISGLPTKKRVRSKVSNDAHKGELKIQEKVHNSSSGGDFESDGSEEAKPTRRRKASESEKVKKPPRKRSRQSIKSTGESELEKLFSVLRAIGLRMPASKLKGKSVDGKYIAILEHLKSKGVTEASPTKLTKRELDRHRRRLEREKDMADIDVRWVHIIVKLFC